MRIQTNLLEMAVYKKMDTGSKPSIPHGNPNLMLQHREDFSEEIVNLFFPQQYSEDPEEDPQLTRSRARFGLIVGPTGTGKTILVTDLCNRFSKGVIYFQVCEPTVFTNNRHEN